MEDLKPCPFCGASDTSDVYVDRLQNDGRRWAVRCDALDCIVEGPHRATKREAITAWNTRTDVSNALIAAAYEAACELVAHDYVCDAIRDLTPDDARAAYDAAIRAAKIEGMREALALVYHDNQKHPEDNRVWGEGGRPYVCEENLHERITALIEETEKGGNKHGPLRTAKNVPV